MHRSPITKPLPDRAARQRQRDARGKIEPDEHAYVGEADAKCGAEQRCHRSNALELKRHREANNEQDAEDKPSILPHAWSLRTGWKARFGPHAGPVKPGLAAPAASLSFEH